MSALQLQNATNCFTQGVDSLNRVRFTRLDQDVNNLRQDAAALQRPVPKLAQIDVQQRIRTLHQEINHQLALIESNKAAIELANQSLSTLSTNLTSLKGSVLQAESNYFWKTTSYWKFGYLAIVRSSSYAYNNPYKTIAGAMAVVGGSAYFMNKI